MRFTLDPKRIGRAARILPLVAFPILPPHGDAHTHEKDKTPGPLSYEQKVVVSGRASVSANLVTSGSLQWFVRGPPETQ
jgi:hypothetical protein